MKKITILFLLLTLSILWGCQNNPSVVAPYGSEITTDPESITFSDYSSNNPVQNKVFIDIIVFDEDGLPKSGQELFFYCHLCDSGTVELHNESGGLIDLSGSVHAVTGDSGNYYLWVYFYSGTFLDYNTDIRITSGVNNAYVTLTVDNDKS